MFIRWKRDKGPNARYLGDRMRCFVVKSVRVEGKPRQQTVKYIGACRAPVLETAVSERWRGSVYRSVNFFWEIADVAFEEMTSSGIDVDTIRQSLAEQVPRVTEEDMASYEEPLRKQKEKWEKRRTLKHARTRMRRLLEHRSAQE